MPLACGRQSMPSLIASKFQPYTKELRQWITTCKQIIHPPSVFQLSHQFFESLEHPVVVEMHWTGQPHTTSFQKTSQTRWQIIIIVYTIIITKRITPWRTPRALFLLRLINKERKKGFGMCGIPWHHFRGWCHIQSKELTHELETSCSLSK